MSGISSPTSAAKRLMLAAIVVYLLLVISTLYGELYKWIALAGVIYALPVGFFVFKSVLVRSYGYWLGAFIGLQIIASYWVTDINYVTLTPNMDIKVDVQAGIPGISGIQRITTDAMGFRVTKEIDYSKKNGLRIFAIGGSTTEQIYLDDHHTWTHLLQERLQKDTNKNVEVINTGVAGLRAINHVSTLLKIKKLQPDIAIFLVGVNDWNRHIRANFGEVEKDSRLLRFQQTILGKAVRLLYEYLKPRREPKENQNKRVDRGEYYEAQRNSLSRSIQHRFRPESVSSEYAGNLDRINEECKNSNMKCIFISQPTAYRKEAQANFRKLFWMTPPNEKYTLDFNSMIHVANLYNNYLKSFATRNDHHFCNLAESMPASVASYYDDCHFNRAGARRVASNLLTCVKRMQSSNNP